MLAHRLSSGFGVPRGPGARPRDAGKKRRDYGSDGDSHVLRSAARRAPDRSALARRPLPAVTLARRQMHGHLPAAQLYLSAPDTAISIRSDFVLSHFFSRQSA